MNDAARIVVLVTLGGGIGGLLYWTSLYLAFANADNPASKTFPNTATFCFAQTFMGAGGAWALLLAMLWGKRAPLTGSVEDELQTFAGSLVAGFAGSKLLPMKSIEVLRALIKAKLSKGSPPDGDVADAYWNIANYAEELYGTTKVREHREAAISAVSESIKIVPGYLNNLKTDPDFADLRKDPEARKRLPPL